MKNNIRWLLTESRLSNLDTNKVNFIDGKLICYHLTEKRNWLRYNEEVGLMDSPETQPDKEILPTDTKAQRIVKKITNAKKNKRPEDWQIEEFVIEDMISDPYTDTSGFSPGGGDYHGKGLYTCYKFNPNIASSYGNICLVFEIDIKNFLITFEDLAKQVHGDNWRIKDQLLKFYQLEERNKESIEKYKALLSEIPDDELKMPKSIYSTRRTANISQLLIRKFSKVLITSLYDGIILFGTGDGPVCASFHPKYDAKLIGLGRLNKKRPEIVDWYDSLNDFLGGRAKLKQDFETINSIAEELTDPVEKEQMKSEERTPFDMEYLKITAFFSKYNQAASSNKNALINTLFNFYQDFKTSGNNKRFEFFLTSFKKQAVKGYYILTDIISSKGEECNELIDETVEFYNRQNKDISFFLNSTFGVYVENRVKMSDFFLKNAVDECLSEKLFREDAWKAKTFYTELVEYMKENTINSEIQKLIDERLYEIGSNLVVETRRAEKILNYYTESDDYNKDKILKILVDDLNKLNTILDWQNVTSKNYKVANELIEKIIDITVTSRPSYNYEINIIKYFAANLLDINYFSNKINEFLASSFLNNMDELKELQRYIYNNTYAYLTQKLGNSHPIMLQVEEVISQNIKEAEDEINAFIEKLRLGNVTKNQLKKQIVNHIENQNYSVYLGKQSKEWFSNFIKLIINNITIGNFKVLGKKEAEYLITLMISQNIVLTREEQFKFTRKLGKSDYRSKNIIAEYNYLDPDVFIELLGPDLKKGGMGAGLSFQGFENSIGVYKLLYKHKKIVDLFGRVAKPGLLSMIIKNISETLDGNLIKNAWGGKLNGYFTPWNLDALPFAKVSREESTIQEIIDTNNIEWFEYFLESVKLNPGRGLKKPVAALEKSINNKKATSTDQAQDDLDPQLDLNHRQIFGNSLKEVYDF